MKLHFIKENEVVLVLQVVFQDGEAKEWIQNGI